MNKGFIRMSNEIYVDNYHILHKIFKDFRPLHLEYRHWDNNIWVMYGVSEKFDLVTEGDEIPQYDVIFTVKKGRVTWKFEKVNR